MKQKKLTKKQEQIVERLHDVLAEADAAGIGLVYDTYDKTLSAFNAENVSSRYGCDFSGRDEGEANIDWDKCSVVDFTLIDYVDTSYHHYMLEFEE